MVYEDKKIEFERNLQKCELKPTPNQWFLKHNQQGIYIPDGSGKCCALSPSLLGKQSNYSIGSVLDMPDNWVAGATNGFDSANFTTNSSEFKDGYAWGRYMREKYVKP